MNELLDPAFFVTEHEFVRESGPSAAGLLQWHGDTKPEPPRWLVRDALPETGVAILAGQSGVAKTFVAVDLSACVMTGRDFAGHAIERRGGVLFLPAEGEAELDARMQAHVGDKVMPAREDLPTDLDPSRLPFARQSGAVPLLSGPDAEANLLTLAHAAQGGLNARHGGLPLALIVIDTMSAAAGFQDENSASEAQRVMNMLRSVSRRTDALVLAIDHFGKLAETGVRGSSAKQAAADAVLAVLADKDQAGKMSNRRLAKHKLRSAAAGGEVPFAIRAVRLDEDGNTSCVVDWADARPVTLPAKAPVNPWRGKAQILKRALDVVLVDQGQVVLPFGPQGPTVRAAEKRIVRVEFDASYPADDGAKLDTKRRTFNRAVETAVGKGHLAMRSIDELEWLWLP